MDNCTRSLAYREFMEDEYEKVDNILASPFAISFELWNMLNALNKQERISKNLIDGKAYILLILYYRL